ncbi:MAG: PAS domain S-box protein [bacterium]|nr:PAS domain S-box protein [bacterium]
MKTLKIEILLISNDLEYKEHLTKVLTSSRKFDFSISMSKDVEKAFENINDKSFDVILLDLDLIKHNPMRLLKIATSNTPELPIIIVSNEEDAEQAVNSVRYGASDYLLKAQNNAHILSIAIRYTIERRKTEKFQKEQLHFLQSVMDNIPSPLFLKGTDLTFGACNTAFETLVGKSKNDIIGKTVFDIFDDYNSEILREKEVYLISHGGTEVYELTIQKSKKKHTNMVFHETTHKRADNSLAGLIGVGSDVTQLKKAEHSLILAKNNLQKKVNERTKALKNSNHFLKTQIIQRKKIYDQLQRERKIFLNGPVIVFRYQIGEEDVLEFVSPNISRFGYTRQELIDKHFTFYNIIDGNECKKVVYKIKKYIHKNIDNFELKFAIVSKDGIIKTKVHAYMAITRNSDNFPIHIDGYIIDSSYWIDSNS